MPAVSKEAPIGVQILQKISWKCCPRFQINRLLCYRISVLILTYLTYMTYHLTRKPISVVKNVLHRNCSELTPDVAPASDDWCDWAPFNTSDANTLLGTLDSAFLFSYAGAMFVSGMIAERVDLRYFLSLGMLVSAIFCYLFGLAKTLGIHHLGYYIVVQACAGIAQTTGWPGTVAVVGKWFGKTKKGLIFGIWNSHTSLGNIFGTLIAAEYVETDWAYSFIYPALVMGCAGLVVFLFLVPEPGHVGISLEERGESRSSRRSSDGDDTQVIVGDQTANLRSNRHSTNNYHDPDLEATEETSLLTRSHEASKAVPLSTALAIPGVIDYSLSLLFAKLVSYTFLYWLPAYIHNSTSLTPQQCGILSAVFDVGGLLGAVIAGYSSDTSLTPQQCGVLSAVFDVGGLLGAVAAGYGSDRSGLPAVVCGISYAGAAVALFAYQLWGSLSYNINVVLLILTGILVNGPYSLITTAVSADLGTHSSLQGNSQALATVTAIIDGTGSIGAAIGPMLAGVVSSYGDWSHVFYMLIACDCLALLFILRIAKSEIVKLRQERRLSTARGVRIE